MKGRFISYDHLTGFLTVEIKDLPPEEIKRLDGAFVDVERVKKKRSLDANAYFHVLVQKIAEAVKSSNVEVKNHLIRDYGQYEYIDGKIPTYSVNADYVEMMLNREDIHFKHVGWDGDRAKLAVMRGSHTYNTAEMAHLIDMTVIVAKAMGIETMPPAELERMMNQWQSTADKKEKPENSNSHTS